MPTPGSRLDETQIDALLDLTRSEDTRERQLAAKNLCTCHLQRDDPRVGVTLLSMLDDPEPSVRLDVLHALTDSTPRERVLAVVAALERRWSDPDPKVRRRIRGTLNYYRRSGRLTDAPR
jgi:uncharacterized protein (DUF2336 family)